MRPSPNRDPANSREVGIRLRVAAAIGLNLLPPPGSVCARPGGVRGASVPKAPIDEHSDTGVRERKIGTASREPFDRRVSFEHQAQPMEFAFQMNLWSRLALANCPHPRCRFGG